jgi:hypothetical protein
MNPQKPIDFVVFVGHKSTSTTKGRAHRYTDSYREVVRSPAACYEDLQL